MRIPDYKVKLFLNTYPLLTPALLAHVFSVVGTCSFGVVGKTGGMKTPENNVHKISNYRFTQISSFQRSFSQRLTDWNYIDTISKSFWSFTHLIGAHLVQTRYPAPLMCILEMRSVVQLLSMTSAVCKSGDTKHTAHM